MYTTSVHLIKHASFFTREYSFFTNSKVWYLIWFYTLKMTANIHLNVIVSNVQDMMRYSRLGI